VYSKCKYCNLLSQFNHLFFFLFSVKKDYGLKYASNDYLRVGNHQSKDGNLIIVTIKKFSDIETIKS
jgi:hypothetical protein